VAFVVDAVADVYVEAHDAAVLRLAHAGAVPNNTVGMVAEPPNCTLPRSRSD